MSPLAAVDEHSSASPAPPVPNKGSYSGLVGETDHFTVITSGEEAGPRDLAAREQAREYEVYSPTTTVGPVSAAISPKIGPSPILVFPQAATTKPLPRRHIVTVFEPHLRIHLVTELLDRVESVRDNLGEVGIASSVSRLKRSLADAFRSTALRQDSKSLSWIVSALQTLFRRHWTEMEESELDEIKSVLKRLAKEKGTLKTASARALVKKLLRVSRHGVDFPSD